VTAEALGGDITQKGHVAVYGIYFDTDKATLKPESDPVLAEIGKLLSETPALEIWVVGHTDSQGTHEHNMDLSKRRAEAVVKELSTRYGVAAARLQAGGVGPLSPVATNRSEEGRARNRRVELVER
jgi:outer membrane protein OmpA-like peptidoglycan-associated protein